MKTSILPNFMGKIFLQGLLSVSFLLFLQPSVAQLSGTYTLGTGQQYSNFSAACAALGTQGVSGHVVFNVQPGTYTEQFTIPYIPNASENRTITFQSSTGNSADVLVQYDATDGNDNFVVKLTQCSYVTIRNMSFHGVDPTYGRSILMEGYVYNFTLEGCKLKGRYNTNALANNALIWGSSILVRSLTIRNNQFSKGSYGIMINSAGQNNLNPRLESNTFDSLGYCAIYFMLQDNPIVEKNQISNSSYGIELRNGSNKTIVHANKLSNISHTGVFCSNLQSVPGYISLISNNSVSLTPSAQVGIDLQNCSYLNCYNNTVVNNTQTFTTAKLLQLAYCTNQTINVMNNNLVALNKGYTIYSVGADQIKNCDYNNFYTTANYFAFWGQPCEDFRTLKEVSGKNEHSLFAYPNFASTQDLVPNSAWLDGAGIPLAEVIHDIEGNARDAGHPDIGAWEFSADAALSPPLAGNYTIGAGGNFLNLNSAIQEAEKRGISDTLRLKILPGYYEGQCIIPPITGASSKKPVIIESSTTNRDVNLWINANDQNDNYILFLKGASFVEMNNLRFHANDPRFAKIIELQGMVDSLKIRNCLLKSTVQNDANGHAIVVNTSDLNFHHQLFENDSILNGSTAIMMNFTDYISEPGEFHLKNSFLDNGYQNLFINRAQFVHISGNRMISKSYGMRLSYIKKNVVIEKNYSYSKYGGCLDLSWVKLQDFTNGRIINNFFLSDYANCNNNMVRIYNCDRFDIYYNSFSMASSSNYVAFNIQNSEIINLKNNIFYNAGTAYSLYTSTTNFNSADHNCFYSQGANLAYWNSACADLDAIKTASSGNQHSVMANPIFASPTDLHASSAFIDGAGTPIAGIDTDIDGQPRHVTTPDIGADEFSLVPDTPPAVVKPIPDIQTKEDAGEREVALLDTVFSNLDEGDVLTYSVESNNQDVLAEIRNKVLYLNSSLNYFGEARIIVTAKDIMLNTARDTFMVEIESVNDFPVAVDDQYNASGAITMCVLENDYDVDSEKLVLISFTQPKHGEVKRIGGGDCLSYTPSPHIKLPAEPDTFHYVIGDPDKATDTAMVVITRILVKDGFTSQALSTEGLSHGSAAWGDYDSDGDLDILITGWLGTYDDHRTRIYENTDTGFVLVDIELDGVSPGTSNAASWCDYDNDNDLDFIVCGQLNNGGGANKTIFYENRDQSFVKSTEVTPENLYGGSAEWAHYDLDGKYDLMISGKYGASGLTKIYRNHGLLSGDTSWSLGPLQISLPGIWSGESNWVDFDSDGNQDIFICGFGAEPSALYRKSGYDLIPMIINIPYAGNGASAWGDYDQDGDPDLALIGKDGETYFSKIFRNDGPGNEADHWVFTDIEANLVGMCSGDVEWGDADNDGDLDLIITGNTSTFTSDTKLYINNNGTFVESVSKFTDMGRSCAAWGDYDNDGDLDLLMSGFSPSLAQPVTLVYTNQRNATNSPPSLPSWLDFTIDGEEVILSWEPAMDDHSTRLSYNVKISTQPGLGDVLNPMSQSNGFRKIVKTGNAGQRTNMTVSGLGKGKPYYWSVQAIDNSFLGSGFANEQRLTLPTGVSNNNIEQIKLYPNPVSDYLYLEFTDGKIYADDVSFYDAMGRKVWVNMITAASLDERLCYELGNLPAGVYVVIVRSEKYTMREVFVKE